MSCTIDYHPVALPDCIQDCAAVSYTHLQAALQAKVVNGKLSFNLEQEKILKEAEVNVMVYNGEGEGTVKTAKGWNEFQDFIIQGGRFSKDLPGDAIFYTASYLSDNSPFYSKFKIHLEN